MDLKIEKKVSLAKYTTLRVGGLADYFIEVHNVDELKEALQFALQTATPPLIIGGGSNILVSDNGYKGVVIKNSISGVKYIKQGSEVFVTAGSGENWDKLVAETVNKNYWGLENLSAIPGTVGATPVQNVGAYGVEVSSLITEVNAINSKTLKQKKFSNEECHFNYRDSFFKTEIGKDWAITAVVFKLSVKPTPVLNYSSLENLSPVDSSEVVRQEVIKIRSNKFPDLHKVGTAGSFFKNPTVSEETANKLKQKYPDIPCYLSDNSMIKISLGYILDKFCGLRGYCENGVCLYENQALVLVNENAKEAKAIDDFANHIALVVKEKTGIEIEREVRSV